MNANKSVTTVLLAGVGGQGTILAADLLSRAAYEAGYDVKVSEIHGMSQRGGAVTTVVRFGDDVHSMVCDRGTVDCLVSFEKIEALRNLSFLAADGYLLVNDETILPQSVANGTVAAPVDVEGVLLRNGAELVPAAELAKQAGSVKSSNVVLLGALSNRLDFPKEAWINAITQRVPPKTVEANLLAFDLGRSNG